jgi:surface carbohydrate biosynthesis protein (TIGR04326 family)
VSYGRTVRALLQSGIAFLLPHAWLTPGDVVKAARADLAWRRPRGPFPPFRSLDIGPLIESDLAQDRATARLAVNFLYALLVERWRNADLPVAAFVYSYENHLWERAFCLGFERAFPSARRIGYQDANVPDLCTNFFFAEDERARVPGPHLVVTNGPYSFEVFRHAGYGEDRLLKGGAIRFESSVRRLDPEVRQGRQDGDGERLPPVALVVVPSSKALAAELVQKTLAALGGESDIRVVIKCHPVFPFEDVARELGGVTLPRHFEVATRLFGELLPQAGILVYMDSTTSVEALAHGLGVVHVASEWSLDLDTIGPDCEERVRTRAPGELRAAVRALLSEEGDRLAERRRRGRALAARFFGRTGEAAYRPVLDALGQPSSDLETDTPALSSASGRP